MARSREEVLGLIEQNREGLKRLGVRLVVLLIGGSKRTQKADIRRARALASLLN